MSLGDRFAIGRQNVLQVVVGKEAAVIVRLVITQAQL
jgi:hypothetical protein